MPRSANKFLLRESPRKLQGEAVRFGALINDLAWELEDWR
jgi:hypothetical protein